MDRALRYRQMPPASGLAGLPPSVRRGPSAGPVAARRDERAPFSPALKLILLTVFLPEGLSFFVFGLRLTATRAIFLVLVPLLILRLGQQLAAGELRFVPSDLLFAAAGSWMILAPAQIIGLPEALRHAGPTALEFCVAYMATRVLLSEHGQALSLADYLCRVIAVVALLGLLDPLTGSLVVRKAVEALTHYYPPGREVDFRFGLLRALGPLEQTILYGLACAIGLLLALGVPVRPRKMTILCCALGLMFSFSAGPVLGVALGAALLAYDRLLAHLQHRWFALAGVLAAAVGLLFVISKAPFGFLISHLTYDPQSSYYRLYVWQLVGDKVLQSPWFGTGVVEWEDIVRALSLSKSVDSLWLYSAMIFGIPGSALIGLALIGSTWLPVSGPKADLTPAEARLSMTLAIVIYVLVFTGFTVHLWGSDWILCGLLAGTKAHLGQLGRR